MTIARRLDGVVGRLATRRAQTVTLMLSVLLASTSIGPHRTLDDYVLALIARGRGAVLGLSQNSLDLFTFTTGDSESNRRLMDVGLMLPWWTDERLHIAFFRPLSSLTHWLDEHLWPEHVRLMHMHSLLWFAAMLAAVLLVYRRLEGAPRIAGLAFALFALDDAHGPALAWLANRNALIAATLGCLCLVAHDAWRRTRKRLYAVLATLALSAGLLAGELAVGSLAYIVSYAIFIERGSPLRRLLSLAPYLVVLGGWRWAWVSSGFGAHGSGAYVDPLGDPVAFLSVLPEKLVVLMQGQFGALPSDLAFLGPPAHRPILLVFGAATVGVVGYLLAPLVLRDRRASFWACGTLLALLPLAATFPSDRLLLLAGLGAMALLARLFERFVARASQGKLRVTTAPLLTTALLILHGFAAPLLLPLRAAQMQIFGLAQDRAEQSIASGPEIAKQTVVIIGAPVVLLANYIQAERELEGRPRPEHLHVLATASSPLRVERTGPTSFSIRPAQGFLQTPLDRHYRGAVGSLQIAQKVVLSALTAEVRTKTADGRPETVEFTLTQPKHAYQLLTWRRNRFEQFELPPIGKTLTLPAEDLGKILLSGALRQF